MSTGKGTRRSAQRFQTACRSRPSTYSIARKIRSPLQAGVEHRHQVAVRQPQRDHRLVAEAARVLGRDDVGRHLLDHAQLLQPGRAGQRQVELPHPAARERLEQHVGIELAREIPPGSRRACYPAPGSVTGRIVSPIEVLCDETAVDSSAIMNGSVTGDGGGGRSAGRRIVLGVTGGIAAYKAAELCRLFVKAGATVRVVMTEAATRFITPLTLQTLSGAPVALDLFDAAQEAEIGHIRLADEADLLVVAPATADAIARMAAGMAERPAGGGRAGDARAGAAGAGHEREHVGEPADAGEPGPAARARRAAGASRRSAPTAASWPAAGSAPGG